MLHSLPCPNPPLALTLALTLALLILAWPIDRAIAETPVLRVPPPDRSGESLPAPPAERAEPGAPQPAGGAVFYSVLVGHFLDEAPAKRLAERLQARGLTAFAAPRRLVESRFFLDGFLSGSRAGEFYLTLAGLFGLAREAERLGTRLEAEGLIGGWQVVKIEDPGEVAATAAQTRRVDREGERSARTTRARAGAPLSPSSPVVTGEAFKKNIHGRYVGSYRDPLEAREHARRLTAGGWPASVRAEGQGGGRWHRVYLAPSEDPRELKADPEILAEAAASAAGRMTLVLLADLTSTAGQVGVPAPEPGRRDASACAGFSQAGRLGAVLSRTIIYVPDTAITAALIPAVRDEIKNVRQVPRRLADWWNEKEPRPVSLAAYGPALFNRLEMERAILSLRADPRPGSILPALRASALPLGSQTGRRVLLVFSDFLGPAKPEALQAAVAALRGRLGDALDLIFVYGDPDGPGYRLAQSLADGTAWDGCRLLHDNAYFEKYIKTVFK